MFKLSTLLAVGVLAGVLGPVSMAGPATAHSTAHATGSGTAGSAVRKSASACWRLQVMGGRVGVRKYPFFNAAILDTVRRGTVLTSCTLVHPNGPYHAPKCGRGGYDWYKVISGRRTFGGSLFGYVPASCVRELPVSAVPAATHSSARHVTHLAAMRCPKLLVTGRKVAIRDFPNKRIIRVVKRGTLIEGVCSLIGNDWSRYANRKCGRAGRDWHQVISGRIVNGSKYGYVPATCVREI
ncbi:hypothetical protein ACIA8R_05115 [Nonomuraea sp. NPDC051191]|uniref:hypothetical protein n=1 Tax=Nonomuraea sp. NPDC051191 TaxID=3364372 RepID=UPI003795169E